MSSSGVRISAVICTRDRRRYLEKSIDSLLRQSLTADRYEIVVVDSASSDDTADFLARTQEPITRFRSLIEERPGLSRARNRALEAVRGEIVAFLDDDAVASEDWLERILLAFDAGGPRLAVLGGKTEPIWEASRPVWLSDRELGTLAIIDWAPEPRFLCKGEYIVGANMAFRTALLRAAGGFPEHLGRVGDVLLSGEEIFVSRRLGERGHPTFYDPGVVVRHHVQRERLDRRWFRRRAYWQGVSDAIGLQPGTRSGALIEAAGRAPRLVGCLFSALYFLVTGDRARRFDECLSAIRTVSETSARLGVPFLSTAGTPRGSCQFKSLR